jgi:hypothetical protein
MYLQSYLPYIFIDMLLIQLMIKIVNELKIPNYLHTKWCSVIECLYLYVGYYFYSVPTGNQKLNRYENEPEH